jgi:hypothetical protein
MTAFMRLAAAVAVALTLSGCMGGDVAGRAPMRWDHLPQAQDWTETTLAAIRRDGADLIAAEPADISTYCPGYARAGDAQRAKFWAGILSAIAKHESTWNPRAKGAGGRYLGLLQISPATARGAGCEAGRLLDGPHNLACSVRIAARRAEAPRVAQVLADWGPMHRSAARADVAAWTRAQPYCRG